MNVWNFFFRSIKKQISESFRDKNIFSNRRLSQEKIRYNCRATGGLLFVFLSYIFNTEDKRFSLSRSGLLLEITRDTIHNIPLIMNNLHKDSRDRTRTRWIVDKAARDERDSLLCCVREAGMNKNSDKDRPYRQCMSNDDNKWNRRARFFHESLAVFFSRVARFFAVGAQSSSLYRRNAFTRFRKKLIYPTLHKCHKIYSVIFCYRGIYLDITIMFKKMRSLMNHRCFIINAYFGCTYTIFCFYARQIGLSNISICLRTWQNGVFTNTREEDHVFVNKNYL